MAKVFSHAVVFGAVLVSGLMLKAPEGDKYVTKEREQAFRELWERVYDKNDTNATTNCDKVYREYQNACYDTVTEALPAISGMRQWLLSAARRWQDLKSKSPNYKPADPQSVIRSEENKIRSFNTCKTKRRTFQNSMCGPVMYRDADLKTSSSGQSWASHEHFAQEMQIAWDAVNRDNANALTEMMPSSTAGGSLTGSLTGKISLTGGNMKLGPNWAQKKTTAQQPFLADAPVLKRQKTGEVAGTPLAAAAA